MTSANFELIVENDSEISRLDATRVTLNLLKVISYDGGKLDCQLLKSIASHLQDSPNLLVIGSKKFIDYFYKLIPDFENVPIRTIVYGEEFIDANPLASAHFDYLDLPNDLENVFVAETFMNRIMQIKSFFGDSVNIIDLSILNKIVPHLIPHSLYSPIQNNIYPINVPLIDVRSGLDFVILDCPSRNLSLMPNGLAYVNNALKKYNVTFQILDLDIISYHRFHIHRLYDSSGAVTLPGGIKLPEDPWLAEHYDLWTSAGGKGGDGSGENQLLEFFRPVLDEAIEAIILARPKILGLSIQGCNEAASREVALGVKRRMPEIIIVVGGFSCYNPDVGLRAFPECDYMCIGEADLTIGPLIEAIARGDQPKNQPGVLSHFDTEDHKFIPAPMVHDLDKIEFPKYEWCDLNIYRNFNDYQLTPIIASRGCRWSRCTFCAERFYWRIRTPENFVDELEWLVDKGCYLFMFNESDLGGMPERVVEICDEIIKRGLHRKVKLTGQLRVNKLQDKSFFNKLSEANFVALRFGIDAFSENTLRLQKKGYTVQMISQNLKDCWESGIYTEINWVIGVPGETEADVDEGIDLVIKNKEYIGRISNINPLILLNGSVYWIDPDAHDIVLKQPKDILYNKYPRALPADQWHSINPFIDASIRKTRFEKIVTALVEAKFELGGWAQSVVEDVRLSRDAARTAGGDEGAVNFGEFEVAGGAERKPDLAKVSEKNRAVISIKNEELDSALNGKKTAEPPLYKIAGEPPIFIRIIDDYKLFTHNGKYYAVPCAINLDNNQSNFFDLPGVIQKQSERDVIDEIYLNNIWANSRGQYDDQEKQKLKGSYIKVNSLTQRDETIQAVKVEDTDLISHNDQYYLVARDQLSKIFNRKIKDISLSKNEKELFKLSVSHPTSNSFFSRLCKLLPLETYSEIAYFVHKILIKGSKSSHRSLRSLGPQELILTIGNLLIQKSFITLKLRFKSILGGKKINNQSPIYEIINAFSKNAIPELVSTLNNYNIVKFDGSLYGVPQGLHIDWELFVPKNIPGIFIGQTIAEVDSKINLIFSGNALIAPKETLNIQNNLLKDIIEVKDFSMAPDYGYNIILYEGWYYGVPQKLGSIDLTQIDILELDGVIRDVSKEAVEVEVANIQASL